MRYDLLGMDGLSGLGSVDGRFALVLVATRLTLPTDSPRPRSACVRAYARTYSVRVHSRVLSESCDVIALGLPPSLFHRFNKMPMRGCLLGLVHVRSIFRKPYLLLS